MSHATAWPVTVSRTMRSPLPSPSKSWFTGVIFGVTVNVAPLLATPPTVTQTAPVVAPAGTAATMLVVDQLVGAAVTPLNMTVLVPCVPPNVVPVIVTAVPTGPLVGASVVILGATVNVTPLLARPPTVTTTAPVVAPAGTATAMLVADQLVGVAAVPWNVTVLVPCVAPKFEPVIVTGVATGPIVVDRLVMLGGIGGAGTSKNTS